MNCIIVDDEPTSVIVLRKLLQQFCPEITIVGEAHSGDEAIELIRQHKPDLVFLDIEMPFGNAFDLLKRLPVIDFEIIFVTAFDNYAVNAFKFSALDYLLKPVDIDDLKKAVSKAQQRLKEKNFNQRLENFLHNVSQAGTHKIALPTLEGLVFFDTNDIINCTAEGPYTVFNFKDGKNLLVTGTLKEFEEMLPENSFCRVHHSHLINIDHIRKYYKGKGGYVEMTNGKTIEVSQRKKDEFLERFRHNHEK